MNVRQLREAIEDLDEALDHYAKIHASLVQSLADEVMKRIQKMKDDF